MDPNRHSRGEKRKPKTVIFGRDTIRIEDVVALARGEVEAALAAEPGYRARLKDAQQLLQELFEAGQTPIYGMSTGVGSSVGNAIPSELAGELGANLFRLHGVGTGRILDDDEAAAVVAARLPGLARGHSGVGAELLERLCLLLNERVLPQIPAEGSVGASGDLTPLSYLAAVLAGEREVSFQGRLMPAADALREIRVDPLQLSARDTLAIMNGTSAMTGLACLAFDRAQALARLAAAVTA
ncbi:MAG: aromatic amino acid lyase, partial [Myxococcota bacterium]